MGAAIMRTDGTSGPRDLSGAGVAGRLGVIDADDRVAIEGEARQAAECTLPAPRVVP